MSTIAVRRCVALAAAFTCVFMVGFAVSNSMYSTMMPRMIEEYALGLKQASALTVTADIGQSLAMLVTLLLADRLNKRILLTWMALVYGTALLATGAAPAYIVLLAVRLCIGLFGGMVDNLCAAYISDLFGVQRARYISILHTLFAAGSMAAPSFAAFCIKTKGWQTGYLVSGGVMAGAALLFMALSRLIGIARAEGALANDEKNRETNATRTPNAATHEKENIPYREILSSPFIRWLCLSSMLLSGVTYLTIWLPTYLEQFDKTVYTVTFCTTLMTANYVGMILSRSGLAFLGSRLPPEVYLRWSSLLSALLVAAMLLVQQPMFWMAGTLLFGILSGASYTARIVLACKAFPRCSATVTAITGVCGTLGSMMISSVVGTMADHGLYTVAMFIPVTALFLVFCVFTFGIRPKVEESG